MWNGYVEYDGTEIINVHRVERYARTRPWFKPTFGNDMLGPMLGHREYRSPLQDDAPWTDPDDEASYDFLGVYPLSIDGFENGTATSNPVDKLTDGAVPGRVRLGPKTLTFSVLLLADSEGGAEYGLRWLKRALLGGLCGASLASEGFGATLCYLSSEPEFDMVKIPWGATQAAAEGGWGGVTGDVVAEGGNAASSGANDPDILGDPILQGGDADDPAPLLTQNTSLFRVTTIDGSRPTECLVPYNRGMRWVTFNDPPRVTRKMSLRSGGEVWTVSFGGIVGVPYEFGPELEVIRGFLDPGVTVPWAGGVEPPGAAIDLTGYIFPDDADCIGADPAPLYDPLNPAIILPPTPPSVPLGNFTPPVNWRRRQFTIPKQYVPTWGEMVPVIQVHARETDLRNLRLRFYADPYNLGDISDDPCAFCGDIVLSYVPQGSTMILDGTTETVSVRSPGGLSQRADSLVFASNGTPFSWPQLSCGFGYVVTLDLPEQDPPPVFDLSLHERII